MLRLVDQLYHLYQCEVFKESSQCLLQYDGKAERNLDNASHNVHSQELIGG